MLKRLLITGAAGALGRLCRERLGGLAEVLRLSDRVDPGPARAGEEVVVCDLGDRAAVREMVEGCDGIVHLGGQPVEAPWEVVRNSNIEGMVNLYEGARASSVRPRILFASSNHAIGFYRQDQRLDASAPVRPDGYYGVSKVFGEALARMYFDKFGIETASVRIGSCLPEPDDHRKLSTWLSPDDFIQLIGRVFAVERLGCPVIYGASANDAGWWDNSAVGWLGWEPRDNAEVFRAKLDATVDLPPEGHPRRVFQGGDFCADPIME